MYVRNTLAGFEAVIHLAALSNDPLGDINPDCTYDINHRGSVHLAKTAKRAGVSRFLYSSSCSLYGAAGSTSVNEEAAFARLSRPMANPRRWPRAAYLPWPIRISVQLTCGMQRPTAYPRGCAVTSS